MAADLEYMRRVASATCPSGQTTVSLDDLVRDVVWRPAKRSADLSLSSAGSGGVRIDSDEYVPFEHLSEAQGALGGEIRDAAYRSHKPALAIAFTDAAAPSARSRWRRQDGRARLPPGDRSSMRAPTTSCSSSRFDLSDSGSG